MSADLPYQLALCQVPYIGHVHAKILADHFSSAYDIFRSSRSQLERIEGIGEVRARSIKNFSDFSGAEKEIVFLEKYHIQPLYLKHKDYPQRLLHCYDPPTLLFYKGNADLNSSKVVAVVGTRSASAYGKLAAEKLVKDLAAWNVLIVSGLAYGIDAVAHKSALKNNLPTIGVVGHGLDTIYPAENTALAKEMLKNGGLLTEFRSNTKPDKFHFPSRNRVVAGISDCIIIVESGIKGGSMITAEIAVGYSRDVFAVPGRITDPKSAGCNSLVRNNKAVLLTEASQLADLMGWADAGPIAANPQKELFIDLSDNEKKIIGLMEEKGAISIDEINFLSGIGAGAVAAAVLQLEMHHLVQCLPGKMYRMMN